MPSDEERGAYGTSKKVKDWLQYNPLGVKVTPFPEETICGLCERKAGIVYPTVVTLCPRCAQRVLERKDIYKKVLKKSFGEVYCDYCGRKTWLYYVINVRICEKCTRQIAKVQQQRRMLDDWGVKRLL